MTTIADRIQKMMHPTETAASAKASDIKVLIVTKGISTRGVPEQLFLKVQIVTDDPEPVKAWKNSLKKAGFKGTSGGYYKQLAPRLVKTPDKLKALVKETKSALLVAVRGAIAANADKAPKNKVDANPARKTTTKLTPAQKKAKLLKLLKEQLKSIPSKEADLIKDVIKELSSDSSKANSGRSASHVFLNGEWTTE